MFFTGTGKNYRKKRKIMKTLSVALTICSVTAMMLTTAFASSEDVTNEYGGYDYVEPAYTEPAYTPQPAYTEPEAYVPETQPPTEPVTEPETEPPETGDITNDITGHIYVMSESDGYEAVLIESDGHFALMDTGSSENYWQLEALLEAKGVTSLDFVVVSEIAPGLGGLIQLSEKYDIGAIYMKNGSIYYDSPEAEAQATLESKGINMVYDIEEESISSLGQLNILFLNCQPDTSYAMFFMDKYRGTAFLGGNLNNDNGDENALMQNRQYLADIDFLKVPGHGDDASNAFAFIQYLNPGSMAITATQVETEETFAGTRAWDNALTYYATPDTGYVEYTFGDMPSIHQNHVGKYLYPDAPLTVDPALGTVTTTETEAAQPAEPEATSWIETETETQPAETQEPASTEPASESTETVAETPAEQNQPAETEPVTEAPTETAAPETQTETPAEAPTTQPAAASEGQFSVVFDTFGRGLFAPEPQRVNDGEHATDPGPVESDGLTFGGWYSDKDCTYAFDFTKPIHEDTVVYARWVFNSYEIEFNANGGQGSMSNIQCIYGEEVPLSTVNFTNPGHIFTGWNTEADGSGTEYADKQTVSNLTKDADAVITLYAQWATEYKITSGNGQTVAPSAGQQAVFTLEGDMQKLKDITLDGKIIECNISGNTVAVPALILSELAPGTHNVNFRFNDGQCSAQFIIAGTPKTGDENNLLIYLAAGIAAMAIAVGVIFKAKKRNADKNH